MKKTLVIGASENPERYSNKAIRALLSHNHDVIALGLKKAQLKESFSIPKKVSLKILIQ